jgi:hypothetical protein
MMKRKPFRLLVTILVLVGLAIPSASALADGTEELGDPSITIANGSGHVAAGTGLISQPGTINIDVPSDSLINQVLLYWEGHGDCGLGGGPASCTLGNSITVDGNVVSGTLIGGPTFFYTLTTGNFYSLSYRADITDLALIDPGANSVSVSGVSFDAPGVAGFANGASIVVIYDDGSHAEVGIKDGNDNAFINFASPLDTTVPQTFNFQPEAVSRVADLTLLVGSVKSPEYPPNELRPNRVVVTVNGVAQYFDNVLSSGDGPTWDTLNLPIQIPAGASSLTVQILSVDGLETGALPASLSWVTAALSVPITPENGTGAGTPGYWKNHPDAWKLDPIVIGGVSYSKAEAIEIMDSPGRGDKTYDMFAHLVATKLNVANGTATSCIADTIAAADEWMATYGPVGSNVRANSDAWKDSGEALKNALDAYNNGLLCAPPR